MRGGSIVVGALAGIGLVTLVSFSAKSMKFERTYNTARFTYADTNCDGIVTQAESDAFDVAILKDRPVTLVPGRMPRYFSGEKISMDTATSWINDYVNEKDPVCYREVPMELRYTTPDK